MGLTDLQQAVRKTGLGGSDIAAVAGMDPYRGPIDVWMEKTGRVPPFEGNEFTKWGNKLEDVIAVAYEERFGLALKRCDTIVHPERPWQVGTPDRLAVPTTRHRTPLHGVEAKNRSIRQLHLWGEDGTSDVPDSVAAQCHWYMSLTGHDRWDVAVLIGGNDFRVYQLRRDADVEASFLDLGERFWRDHVVADKPPRLDGTPGAWDLLLSQHPAARQPLGKSTAGDFADQVARALMAHKQGLAITKAKIEQLEQELCALIGDGAGLKGDDWTATWKEEAGRVSWKAVAEALGAGDDLITQHRGAQARVLRFRTSRTKED